MVYLLVEVSNKICSTYSMNLLMSSLLQNASHNTHSKVYKIVYPNIVVVFGSLLYLKIENCVQVTPVTAVFQQTWIANLSYKKFILELQYRKRALCCLSFLIEVQRENPLETPV